MTLGSIRAPAEHLGLAAWPALDEVPDLLAGNAALLEQADCGVFGQALAHLRAAARAEIAAAARDYLGRRGEPVPDYAVDRLVVGGHQSELFHPGVWVKNFLLAALQRQHGVAGLHLIVDNDAVKTLSLRLPLATDRVPHVGNVPFDDGPLGRPAEEYFVHNETLFSSLSQRANVHWPFAPILGDYWDDVLRCSRPGDTLGERLAAGRRALERRWGCHNLELPVSALARTAAFGTFAADLLVRLPQFHGHYNRCVRDYRAAHRIRSRNHPVPDLARDGDWLEAPLWGWRTGQVQRGRVFARRRGDVLQVRAGSDTPLSLACAELPQAWQALENQGFKVRPRALTMTLFARLFVADLFLHGIGGGKYDELTDELIVAFYGLDAPRILVATATLHLPFSRRAVTEEEQRQLARQLRDLRYNPQRQRVVTEEHNNHIADLLKRRKEWVDRTPLGATEKVERWRALQKLTRELAAYGAERQGRLQAQLAENAVELAANAVLQRRDYAFCLHPASSLRALAARVEAAVSAASSCRRPSIRSTCPAR